MATLTRAQRIAQIEQALAGPSYLADANGKAANWGSRAELRAELTRLQAEEAAENSTARRVTFAHFASD